jgi:hypothetical protein
MSTQLTNKGWSNGSKGRWSDRSNRVRDKNEGIRLSGRYTAKTLAGDDIINGANQEFSGLKISGTLKTQSGNDTIRGESELESGLYNENTIRSGLENDTITGISTNSRGLENQGTIDTEDGSDSLFGRSRRQEGVTNSGYLDMGSGNDTLRGVGVLAGLRNDNYIYMGKGSDVVNVRRGGFDGKGYLDLGPGFDRVIGFGPQTVDGGGDRDSLLLKEGTYTIADTIAENQDEFGFSSGQTITNQGGIAMGTVNFESIGSSRSGAEVKFQTGILVISAEGDVAYL